MHFRGKPSRELGLIIIAGRLFEVPTLQRAWMERTKVGTQKLRSADVYRVKCARQAGASQVCVLEPCALKRSAATVQYSVGQVGIDKGRALVRRYSANELRVDEPRSIESCLLKPPSSFAPWR